MSVEVCEVEPVITLELTWGTGEDAGELLIGPDCPGLDPEGDPPVTGGVWWNALSWPPFGYRYTTAPPSSWMPGQVLLAATVDVSSVVGGVVAIGTDLTELEAQKTLLTTALAQWPVTVTLDVDGTDLATWQGQPSLPVWGAITPQGFGLFVAEATILVPVNPTGA